MNLRIPGGIDPKPYGLDADADDWIHVLNEHFGDTATWAIRRLAAHDHDHGTNFVETLRAYLSTRYPGHAARTLFLHRNTLRYRLLKIRQIVGLDPRDLEDRLVLEVQLRLALLQGIVHTPRN